jgi:hypothetical protein
VNISVWFETFTVVLSGVATTKSTRIMLQSRALYFGCAMFDTKNWRNSILKIIEKTCVIKVSKFSFSKLRV